MPNTAMSGNDASVQQHRRRSSQQASAASFQGRGNESRAARDSSHNGPVVDLGNGTTVSSPQRHRRASEQRPQTARSQNHIGSGPSLGATSINLTGLFSNVHRTTGKRPPGLSGTTATVVGDKLFVFGGLIISRRRMSRSLYELDLVRRHWTKIEPSGDLPMARYFHTMCALGDTKLVLFGGTTGTQAGNATTHHSPTPLSDIFIYNIEQRIWTEIKARNPPTPRYAHCATIIPSSAVFTSNNAPLSALHHNPASRQPNQGTLGVEIDGRGGAEMIVLGGQCDEEKYCYDVDVFNFRSLSWTASMTANMNKFGAYRSAVSTVTSMPESNIGASGTIEGEASFTGFEAQEQDDEDDDLSISSAPVILYNNFNFMNPQVEIRLRRKDGTIADLPARGQHRPPGLRFPAAGLISHHLIVSGSFLRSSAQEYMLWALDLRTLLWHRVDIPSGSLGQGSWNRGVAWNKRNSYIILGDRRRDFQLDYVSRRTNFSHICVVEMEALGLHDNPYRKQQGWDQMRMTAFREHAPNLSLGSLTMGLPEISDMDIIVIDGERIPVNSYLLSQRWGSYFQQLLCEDLGNKVRKDSISDVSTLQPNQIDQANHRISNITITPRSRTSILSQSSIPAWLDGAMRNDSPSSGTTLANAHGIPIPITKPIMRSRLLFLPHTYLTARALVHYLYTLELPSPPDPLCTPQILCSLLQIARPYRISGLLEATVERLFQMLDGRHAAAIFNACAMAAGGGSAVKLSTGVTSFEDVHFASGSRTRPGPRTRSEWQTVINEDSDPETSLSRSASMSSLSSAGVDDTDPDNEMNIWSGDWSAVIGLQKRALRGLMEGKREREQAKKIESEAEAEVNGSSAVANNAV